MKPKKETLIRWLDESVRNLEFEEDVFFNVVLREFEIAVQNTNPGNTGTEEIGDDVIEESEQELIHEEERAEDEDEEEIYKFELD